MEKLNWLYDLKNFDIHLCKFTSKALVSNKIGDSALKSHPLLIPKGKPSKKGFPVVFMLSGFLGNGDQKFNIKSFEMNQVQQLDECVSKGKAPRAVYVFVDAFSSWGGSQFLNSPLLGNYEDMIVKELVAKVESIEDVPVQKRGGQWAVMGGSSGGYGALHLASMYPEVFPWAVAVAPDSYFEVSLKPEIIVAAMEIAQKGGLKEVVRLQKKGKLLKQRNGFKVLNALGMAACYGPKLGKDRSPILPVDLHTGQFNEKLWNSWLEKDPVHFLRARTGALKKLKGVYLTCGHRDQFFLHFGSRQIDEILNKAKAKHKYVEFDGGHFDLSTQNPECWSYLQGKWK